MLPNLSKQSSRIRIDSAWKSKWAPSKNECFGLEIKKGNEFKYKRHMHGNSRTKSSSLSCLNFFFGNLCPLGKYSSRSRSNPDTSQSRRGTPSCQLFYSSVRHTPTPKPKGYPPGLTGGDKQCSLVQI